MKELATHTLLSYTQTPQDHHVPRHWQLIQVVFITKEPMGSLQEMV